MLTAGRSKLREWGLFLLVALLPAAGMGALALRALQNEELAMEQAMAAELERAALEQHARFAASLSELDGASYATMASAANGVAFVDRLSVSATGEVTHPPASHQPRQRDDDACRRKLASLSSTAMKQILEQCRGALTASGRYMWPIVALDPRTEPHPTPPALGKWFEEHGKDMSASERAAARREVTDASWLDAQGRETVLAMLQDRGVTHAAASFVPPRRGAIAAGAREVLWSDARSRGKLVRGPAGDYAGFVMHAGSIVRALRGGWPDLDGGMRARLHLAGAAPGGSSFEVLPGGAYLVVQWSDPSTLARRSRRAEGLLAGSAAVLAALAVGLAALMFARMRDTRRLSALRTDFVAAVSHELRTPIASIRMLAELLAEGRIEDDEKGDAQRALAREAARLGATVNRLLGFSRMEAGKSRARQEPVAVAKVVAKVIDTFEERHPDMPRVVRALDDEAMALGDADDLFMAVDNLLTNARKYAPNGTPYRVVVEKEGRVIRIVVADGGPGIAKHLQEKIFEPFERADDRLSQATEGSGIGLSLVRHVAKSHGGRAYVDSQPGQGASFVVEIPGTEA